MKNKRKVTSLLIHRAQREIGILVVVVLIITTVVLAFMVHLTLQQALEQVSSNEMSGGAVEALLVFKRLLLDRMLVSLGLGIFVIGYVVIKALHRATGPLGRIVLTLRALADGEDPKEIVIRQDDYYVELAQEVNRVIQASRANRSGRASRGD